MATHPSHIPGPGSGPGESASSGTSERSSGESAAAGAGQASRPAPDAAVSPNGGREKNEPAPKPPEAAEASNDTASDQTAGDPAATAESELADVDVGELREQAAKAGEYLELAQRTRAEFENYRRRATKEAAAAQERGVVKLAVELLPALDNLDRALAHAETIDGDGDHSFVAGVKHVHSDLIAALKRAEIEPYSPQGERFDPQFHEAIAQQPFEGAEPGTVVEVYQPGYRRGELVLRPARVVVAG